MAGIIYFSKFVALDFTFVFMGILPMSVQSKKVDPSQGHKFNHGLNFSI